MIPLFDSILVLNVIVIVFSRYFIIVIIIKFHFSLVRRCQHLNPPQFGMFTSSQCSNHYGSVCQVTCTSGYVLQGSSQMTCERNDVTNSMYWDQVGDPPICQSKWMS